MHTLSRTLILLAALVPFAPAAALAAAATAAQNVNVRSGPATSFGVVTQLQQGDAVDVRQCEGAFCEVAFGGRTGWVSASYLTRDTVTKPAPRLPTAQPQIASTSPAPRVIMSPQQGVSAPTQQDFPPAYNGRSARPLDRAPSYDDDRVAADPGAPRPKVDVPGGGFEEPDDFAAADVSPPDDHFGPSEGGWRMTPNPLRPDRFQRFERGDNRRDLAGIGAGGGGSPEACFVDAETGPAFCVRQGEERADLAEWSGRPLLLHNPERLDVTVCSNAAYRDCRTYVDNGPIILGGGRGIASVSAAVGGY